MKIGLDVDGVLTNVEEYVFAHGGKYSYEKGYDMMNWDIEEYSTIDIFNWSTEIDDDFWITILDDYSKHERPRAFAPEVIKKLRDMGHEIYIITARCSMTEEDIKNKTQEKNLIEWLKRNNIEYDKLIFENNKEKPVIENEIDLMIEDYPRNLDRVSMHTNVIVFDAIYNKDVDYVRVNSWYQILYVIENYDKFFGDNNNNNNNETEIDSINSNK